VLVGSVTPAFATPGAVLWIKRYNPYDTSQRARRVAVSPDGSTVFVTGSSIGSTSNYDYATVAYNAGTGAVIWTKRYSGSGDSDDEALAVAVSPDGAKVFVTGFSHRSTSGEDYATIAYSAA